MAENEPGLDPIQEDARLDTLDERLRRARTEEAVRSGEARDKGEDDYRVDRRHGRRSADRLGARSPARDIPLAPARDAVPWNSGRVQEHYQDFEQALEVVFGRLI